MSLSQWNVDITSNQSNGDIAEEELDVISHDVIMHNFKLLQEKDIVCFHLI